jgi:alkaline phosphatase D
MSKSRPGPFQHGVASGDPTSEALILWTRVTAEDPAVEVSWVLGRDRELLHVVASGSAVATSEHDHTVNIDVRGLDPGTRYFYRFHALGAESPVGRTQTLPAGDHLRIAVCACARYMSGYFNAYARIADREDLDFVLHLGDYIYEYGNDERGPRGWLVREVEPPHECITLADYRARYAQYRRDPDVARLHARHPLIATVDDHEFCNDTWRDGAGKHDPVRDGPWHDRKAAALRAWREWMPVRVPDPRDPSRIYRSFEIGSLAHLILIDGRTQRDRQTSDPRVMDDPERTILGPEQFAWFVDQLRASNARWRLVANGVMIGQVYSEFMPEDIGEPLSELGVLTSREHGPEPDQWDGYTAERDRVFRALIELGLGNTVFLSGDVHSSWAVELHRDHREKTDPPLAVEFVTTSVTSENLDEHLGTSARTESLHVERRVIEENPHIRWAELDSHGYFVLDVTPERAQADWYYVEVVGRTPGERLAAMWAVRSGESRLRAAERPTG